MPIQGIKTLAITGADGQVGRALLQRLQTRSFETVALSRTEANLPADRLIVGPLDSTAATTAIWEADAVVHLAGGLRPPGNDSYRVANLQATESLVRAIKEGHARRVVFLSYVGASEHSSNAYLRSKAQAEALIQSTGKEVVTFRCTPIVGSPEAPGPVALALLGKPGSSVSIPGDGTQRVAPLYVEDVAAAFLAAMTGGPTGTYELAGPDQMTMDELVSLLNSSSAVSLRHQPAWLARLLSRVAPAVPGPLMDVLLRDSVGDPSRAVEAFGLHLTSLRARWGAEPVSPERAGPTLVHAGA